MKKILLTAVAVSLAASTHLSALTVTISQVSGYNPGGSGGEFNISPVTGTGYSPSVLVGSGFESFCVSRGVGITIPGTYNATVDPNGTYLTGTTPSVATISRGTAWLYQQFATGVLAGYNYASIGGGTSSGRATSAFYLQDAMWTLEGEYSYIGGLAGDLADNAFLALVAAQYGGGTNGLASAMAANLPGGYDVGTLYLTSANGSPAQGMLTLLPDGGTTLMLMGLGFSSLALVSRKFRA
jgi:hypothetical protein